MRTKQRRRRRFPAKAESPKHIGFAFSEIDTPWSSFTPEQHADALQKLGNAIRAEHTRLLNALDRLIRQSNPLQMLAHFAFYDRTMFDIQTRGSYKPLQQHAVEFFHAYFLTIPVSELPVRSTAPEVIVELNEVLHGLSKTFPMLGIEKRQQSEHERTAVLLSQGVRMHTHGVRNPGYYQQVMRQLRTIFGRVDNAYLSVTGVKLSALVTMCENVVKLLEQRLNVRLDTVRAMRRCKTAQQAVAAYSECAQLGEEDRQPLLEACTKWRLTVEDARAMCVHDADLRLIRLYMFSVGDFVAAYPDAIDAAAISKVLNRWSYPPQALIGFDRDRLFLDNPIWHHPVLQINPNMYFWPAPEMFHSFGWEMLEDLLRPHSQLFRYYQEHARAEYLEDRVVELCHAAFPNAALLRNCKWVADGKTYETDVLLVMDCIALAIECKSARITPAARRGAPERLQREIKKLIEESSRQTARLAEILLSSETGVHLTTDHDAHHIAPGAIKRVIRLNITLDLFGPIACAVRQMVDAKLIDTSVATAATVAETDFENVLRVLETPLERLHYFARRSEIERNLELLADEEDLLACYLATGMNLGDAEFGENRRLVMAPMGNQLQPFLQAMHAGKSATKPRRRFTAWWKQLVSILEKRAFPEWTLIGLVLLDVRHEDQRGFESMVRRMLKSVRSNWRSPDCLNSVYLANGPKERRTAVLAVGVKRSTREARNATMQRAIAIAAQQSETDDLVAICLDAENTIWPYTAIGHTLLPQHAPLVSR